MGVGIHIRPLLNALLLEFSSVNKTVASLWLQAVEKVLAACAYPPNSSSDYPTFPELLDGVLEVVSHVDSLVLLGDFKPFDMLH